MNVELQSSHSLRILGGRCRQASSFRSTLYVECAGPIRERIKMPREIGRSRKAIVFRAEERFTSTVTLYRRTVERCMRFDRCGMWSLEVGSAILFLDNATGRSGAGMQVRSEVEHATIINFGSRFQTIRTLVKLRFQFEFGSRPEERRA